MQESKNILVVDDEKKIVEIVKAYLEKEGYIVFTAENGLQALETFEKNDIHLIVLDLMLPKLSGEKVCSRIRATSDVPIIMLTAKVEEDDKIKGLDLGADDYLTKPFSARELVSRISALMRRCYKGEKPMAEYFIFNDGDLEVDIKRFIIKKKGVEIKFTPNEFKILKILIINAEQVLSREQLLYKAFGINFDGFDRTIDTHIKNIRYKIEYNPKSPEYIQTIYGVGYKFNPGR